MPDKDEVIGFGSQLGCSILFFGAIVLCCTGICSCDKITKERDIQRVVSGNQPFLDANNSKVKVLWVYPQHGHKGRFVGHYAVVEGIKDKARKEIHTHPLLPVPEEIWLITLDSNGHYRFGKRIQE